MIFFGAYLRFDKTSIKKLSIFNKYEYVFGNRV